MRNLPDTKSAPPARIGQGQGQHPLFEPGARVRGEVRLYDRLFQDCAAGDETGDFLDDSTPIL